MTNKKGLSEVIATVMIIMLTVVAIAAIAAFVVPFVRNSLDKGTECLNYANYFVFDESSGLNCYQQSPTGFLHGAHVKSSPDAKLSENIDGFVLAFFSTVGDSKSIYVNSGPSSSELWMLNKAGQDIAIPSNGESRTYIFSNGAKFDSIEVHPLLKSGRICAEKDVIKIVKCQTGVTLG